MKKGREFVSEEARDKVLREFFDRLIATKAMELHAKSEDTGE